MNMLFNVFVGIEGINFTNINLDRILEKIVSKPLYFFRPSCRKKQRLSLFWYMLHNGPYLRFKTHIKHTVGFVQNEEFHFGKVDLLHFKQIIETPWSCNDTLSSSLNLCNLRPFATSTVTANRPKTNGTAKFLNFVCDLTCKLSCWGKYKETSICWWSTIPSPSSSSATTATTSTVTKSTTPSFLILLWDIRTVLHKLMQRWQKKATCFT
mmetsp:Transcript_5442/g.8051  ORF Transcript_5442/g.8051 Transcript_5442/m.8051 type:complete len:210 (-) Transcript_5442:800-1429(-)